MQSTVQSTFTILPNNTLGFIANPSKYHHNNEQLEAELKLIQQVKQDSSNFKGLYNKYYEQIFRFVFQRLNDREQTFDITSQVFLNALTNIHRYEYRGVPFGSWLYKIALNEVSKCFTKQFYLRTINIDSEVLNELLDESEDDLLDANLLTLKGEISRLSKNDLQLIEMRFFDQLSFKEIANITEMTEGNCKVKVYRIIDKIKKNLKT
jgi:RNA polymerase sigma-70 factor (ECF subfamily)